MNVLNIEVKDLYDPISGILYDTLMYWSQTVADDLRLPGINVRITPVTSMLLYSVFPHLGGKGLRLTKLHQVIFMMIIH